MTKRGKATITPEFIAWMEGYCEAFGNFGDGAWQAACENAVNVYNREHGTSIDPYDGFIAWAAETAEPPLPGDTAP